MKKSIAYLLVFAMLLSLGWTVFNPLQAEAADEQQLYVSFEFEDVIDLSVDVGDEDPIDLGAQDNGHGNHQTRIVHTSKGDYVASVSGYRAAEYLTGPHGMLQLCVMFVPADSEESEVVLQTVIPYQSYQISVVADDQENVWAGFVYESNFRDQFDNHKNGMVLEFFRIDHEDHRIDRYQTIVSDIDINGGGIGYSSFYYDPYVGNEGSIIAMAADAVAADPSYLYWKVFDIETLTWAKETHSLQVNGGRNGYIFFNTTKEGGFVIATNRNPSVISNVTYYPEMENDIGIPEEMMQEYFPDGRQHVSYCFDQVNVYVVPDVHSDEYTNFVAFDTDQSRITGTNEERLTPEFRMKNEYPNIANNNGGDIFLDEDGYLHVTCMVSYVKMAWDWEMTEGKWMHAVFDTKTGEKVSESQVFDLMETNDEYDPYARLYSDPVTKELFVVTQENYSIVFYKAVGSPTEGYEYVRVAEHEYPNDRNRDITNINLAHHRSNSVQDGILSMAARNPYAYDLFRVKLSYGPAKAVEYDADSLFTISLQDDKGNALTPEDNKLNLTATDQNEKSYDGTVLSTGKVDFEELVFDKAGEYEVKFALKDASGFTVKDSVSAKFVVEDNNGQLEVTSVTTYVNGEAKDAPQMLITKKTESSDNNKPSTDNSSTDKPSTDTPSTDKPSADTSGGATATGDNANPGLWIVLAAGAAAAFLFVRKKRIVK